jgi:hypothetical protein
MTTDYSAPNSLGPITAARKLVGTFPLKWIFSRGNELQTNSSGRWVHADTTSKEFLRTYNSIFLQTADAVLICDRDYRRH